jgi:antitoxin VapB
LDASINSDTRFALPNRNSRIGPRADEAKRASETVRHSHGGRPLLLTRPSSVNWRTGGLSDPIDVTANVDPVWVLDCDAGNVLITNDVEAPRLEGDFHVGERGWNVLRAPWYEPSAPLALACSFAGVSSDELLSDRDDIGLNVNDDLIAARLVLGVEERGELRELGSLVGLALGAGIESWRPGVTTDFDAAAVITAILEASGATAVCLIVGGDDRLRSFRHPLAVGEIINDAMMAVVVAKRAGLHVAATRLCVRRSDDEIVKLTKTLSAVHDAVLEASVPGGTWGDSINALAAGYESIGQPDAWREHFQGGPIGFDQREFELAPFQTSSPFWNTPRQINTAVAWNPSLRGGAKIEETYLLGGEMELITATPSWPLVERPHGFTRSALKVLS